MPKKITLDIKALNLGDVKDKLAKKGVGTKETEKKSPTPSENKVEKKTLVVSPKEEEKKAATTKARAKPKSAKPAVEEKTSTQQEEAPKIRARSKSVFAESEQAEKKEPAPEIEEPLVVEEHIVEPIEPLPVILEEAIPAPVEEISVAEKEVITPKAEAKIEAPEPVSIPTPPPAAPKFEKLGPTGRHVKDLYTAKSFEKKPIPKEEAPRVADSTGEKRFDKKPRDPVKPVPTVASTEEADSQKAKSKVKFKEFKDIKPTRRQDTTRSFDVRDRQGLRESGEEEHRWKKKRNPKHYAVEEVPDRPTAISVRIPISIKDLAAEMKLKASKLIEKLFLQGTVHTLNDLLDDETAIQLLGHEFGCEITIDTAEEERIRITDKTIQEEIKESNPEDLKMRAPVATFMGHVDHGKTSLIDRIRSSNIAGGESGKITQHIGAFKCHTAVGDITVLDTPGHEAFSAMRARGADITDIVVLVVAGDEGVRQQTNEAIQHAKAAGVTIIVAINKCDKPNFDAEKVYRQLADNDLLPESWGGTTITVNCSAVTGEGVDTLLEMLALQAEVLELRANTKSRARGSVLESEMHKGMGQVATILVQNGTLKLGDAIVFGESWGRVKTMQDEHGKRLLEAGPSTPVEITGLTGLPPAGQEFIVVENEKMAREIAETRSVNLKNVAQQRRPVTIESLLSQSNDSNKKVLNIILRADVQGSLEALKVALTKIESEKVNLCIIFSGIGEISESDVQLAAASKAVIIGYHTQIESHAAMLVKQFGVLIRSYDIIYHAIDGVKELMAGTLDKLAQEVSRAKVEVRALFKSSQHGTIAGCFVLDGTVQRNYHLRIMRDNKEVWKGPIKSLKRMKEDVKEVHKGFECGILINSNDIKEGDLLEIFEIIYIKQEL